MHSDAATQAVRQSLRNKRAELALRQCSARNYACKKDLPLWWLVFVLVLLLRLLLLSGPFLLLARWGLLPLRLRWSLLLLLWPFLRLLTRWGRLLPIYLRRALFLLRSLLRLLTRWGRLLPLHLRRPLLLRLLTWRWLLPLRLWGLLLLWPLLRLLTRRRCGPLLFLLACIGRRRPGGRWSVIALICRTFVARLPIR